MCYVTSINTFAVIINVNLKLSLMSVACDEFPAKANMLGETAGSLAIKCRFHAISIGE